MPEGIGGQYAALRESLRRFGHSRFPALHDEVDDLVDQTLSDLWRFLAPQQGRRVGARDIPDRLFDSEDARRIAFSIFKRRAADAFRANAERWARQPDDDPRAPAGDVLADVAARRLLMRRMLRVCVAELATVSREDRDLLAFAAGLNSRRSGNLAARDRQRLHRLRLRLSDAIRRELGEDAATLLEKDF